MLHKEGVVEERKARGEGRERESERREESSQVGRMNGECRKRVMWEFDKLCAFSSVWVFVLCVCVSVLRRCVCVCSLRLYHRHGV